jgi:hypothetical protein
VAHPVRLTGAVITHPRRAAAARALVASAPAGFLELVLDPDPDGPPNGLRTSIRAWSEIPAGSTHHLVLEDDARLAPGFRAQAERAAAAAPEAAIVLYNNWSSRNGAAVRLGALAGARWAAPVAEYTANVALILPADVGAGFGDYARAHGGTWPDDVILARYLADAGVRTYMTVPNLAQHGELPSISGNELHGLRLSACYAPPPQDADWSLDRVVEPDAVPFFKFGVAQCSIRSGGGWLTVGSDRASARLGVDPDRCAKEFDAALSEPAVRPLADLLAAGRLAAHWWTGYALGLLAARHRSPARWAHDPPAAEAVGTIGPGGLCMELSADRLRALQAPLRELARAAVDAGARQPEYRPTGRRISFAGPDGPLRRVLIEDLTDRGHVVDTGGRAESDVLVEPAEADGALELRCTPRDAAPTVLRLGVPYGPEITGYSPMSEWVLQSVSRQPLRGTTSLPDSVRFAHVWDIARALAKAIESPGVSGTFDVCHDEAVGPRELAELITATIRAVDIDLIRAEPGPAGPVLATESTTRCLGWRPSLDLADGIRTVSQWLAYEAEAS